MTTLSAPCKSGYQRDFATTDQAREAAAALLGVALADMIEVESPDGSVIYCYASQDEADVDQDGAYAVQYLLSAEI